VEAAAEEASPHLAPLFPDLVQSRKSFSALHCSSAFENRPECCRGLSFSHRPGSSYKPRGERPIRSGIFFFFPRQPSVQGICRGQVWVSRVPSAPTGICADGWGSSGPNGGGTCRLGSSLLGTRRSIFQVCFLCLSIAVNFLLLMKIHMFAGLDPGSALHLPLGQDDSRIFLAAEEHGLEFRARGDALDLDTPLAVEAVPIVSSPLSAGRIYMNLKPLHSLTSRGESTPTSKISCPISRKRRVRSVVILIWPHSVSESKMHPMARRTVTRRLRSRAPRLPWVMMALMRIRTRRILVGRNGRGHGCGAVCWRR